MFLVAPGVTRVETYALRAVRVVWLGGDLQVAARMETNTSDSDDPFPTIGGATATGMTYFNKGRSGTHSCNYSPPSLANNK